MALVDEAIVHQLRLDVGIRRLPEVMGIFVAELERRIPLVRSAIDAHDLRALGRESHSLKGSALTFGAPALAEAACRANAAFSCNDPRALLDASADLLLRGPETCAAVAALIAAIDHELADHIEGADR